MFKHFNGWQRLWVLLIALYLVPVVVFTTDAMPKASNYAQTRLHESIDVTGHYLETIKLGYTFEGSYTVRQKYYSDLTDDEVIERLHTKYKDIIDFTRIESKYYRMIDELSIKQVKVVGYALLWWLIPSVVLYLFGIAVIWVIRGFRSEGP